MLWLKSCPRCRGDLLRTSNGSEFVMNCLQCGHTVSEMDARRFSVIGRRQARATPGGSDNALTGASRPDRHAA